GACALDHVREEAAHRADAEAIRVLEVEGAAPERRLVGDRRSRAPDLRSVDEDLTDATLRADVDAKVAERGAVLVHDLDDDLLALHLRRREGQPVERAAGHDLGDRVRRVGRGPTVPDDLDVPGREEGARGRRNEAVAGGADRSMEHEVDVSLHAVVALAL